jgi:hypothetical protein
VVIHNLFSRCVFSFNDVLMNLLTFSAVYCRGTVDATSERFSLFNNTFCSRIMFPWQHEAPKLHLIEGSLTKVVGKCCSTSKIFSSKQG